MPQHETREEVEAYLWRIWDILHLWSDEQWSSEEIELVAETMQYWKGDRGMTPPEYRRQDPEMYEAEAD